MKSHWTIAIYGGVLVLNVLALCAAKGPIMILFVCCITIITFCALRILAEFLDCRI